jgi:hypothetical protein
MRAIGPRRSVRRLPGPAGIPSVRSSSPARRDSAGVDLGVAKLVDEDADRRDEPDQADREQLRRRAPWLPEEPDSEPGKRRHEKRAA